MGKSGTLGKTNKVRERERESERERERERERARESVAFSLTSRYCSVIGDV